MTANSLEQTFNRRVLERALTQDLSLAYAVPDHPWVDEADGAAVRIAMAVVEHGSKPGVLTNVLELVRAGSELSAKDKRERYLRPAYQDPRGAQQHDLGIEVSVPDTATDALLTFPTRLAEQAQVVRQVLQAAGRPLSAGDITARFQGGRSDRVGEIVEMLVELGQARQLGERAVAYAV